MSRVVALFSNQKEVEEAVTALIESGIDESRIYLIEDWQESGAKIRALPTQIPSSGLSGASAAEIETASLSGFDDEERFLKRGVEKGGVVTVIDLSNDAEIPIAEDLVEKLGGRLVSRS